MSSILNTLHYAKKLESGGFNKQQAETLAELQEEVVSNTLINLVTKKDLELVKNEILIKLGGLMVIGMGVLGFILKH